MNDAKLDLFTIVCYCLLQRGAQVNKTVHWWAAEPTPRRFGERSVPPTDAMKCVCYIT